MHLVSFDRKNRRIALQASAQKTCFARNFFEQFKMGQHFKELLARLDCLDIISKSRLGSLMQLSVAGQKNPPFPVRNLQKSVVVG